jgi:cytochrome b561
MTRYATPVVILHWLLAVLILLSLAAGTFALEPTPNSDPSKLTGLAVHMSVGGAILVLMILRLVIRLRTGAPPAANALAPLAHWALYGLVFVMTASGIAMSVYFGLPGIVFGGAGTLPETFNTIGARAVHGIAATVLMAVIALHIAAGIYHWLVKKDGVMGRMGFRR